ncbi:hypothetical protein N9E91_06130 [Alphaproteobacteria bacterium]|jgi:hypothetical protein|nr:hypothetical protein [Alphaproteobacteria bacterium]
MILIVSILMGVVLLVAVGYQRAEMQRNIERDLQLDWQSQYHQRRWADPVSSETFDLIDKIINVSVADHSEWLTDCVDELEEKFEQQWTNRADFIQMNEGIVCWSDNTNMADLFNESGRYEIVCLFLKREPIKELQIELETALASPEPQQLSDKDRSIEDIIAEI